MVKKEQCKSILSISRNALRGRHCEMFRNGIAVYVNGEIRGSWFVQDCEERRRFIPQKETTLMTRKQIAAYNKMPKKDRGPLKKFREETFTAYQTHWTNWQALVKHFEANNADIRLVTPQ